MFVSGKNAFVISPNNQMLLQCNDKNICSIVIFIG